MIKVRIVSTAADLTSNLTTVKAEVLEPFGEMMRVKDVVELEVENGVNLDDGELEKLVEEKYGR